MAIRLRFCVIGGGRIGLPISVRLSEEGQEVTVLEIDKKRSLMINDGVAPFQEEGLQNSLAKGIERA